MSTAVGNLEDMLFFPYNSVQSEYGEEDRLYDSQDWADYFRQFIGNGVFPNPSSGLRVDSLNGSMVLTVRVGAAFANGRVYMQKNDFDFSITPAHLTLGRRDVVVCRHDGINRVMQVLYLEGVPSSVPLAPDIIRTDDIYDLKLCEITVSANTQMITQSSILDTRLDSAVCGIVQGVVDQVDTTVIFAQYQTYLNEQIALWEGIQAEKIEEWDAIKEQETAAWQAQTEDQQSIWGAWFAQLGVDIQIYATFNFDNLAALKGVTYAWTPKADNVITETIVITGSNLLVAKRVSTFPASGEANIITVGEFVYEEDGTTPLRHGVIPYNLDDRKAVIPI